jgi:4-amino-4-deoxy-L-arabinose transferase-like glycosyltransferase
MMTLAIGVIAAGAILFRIGDFDFREDEFQVISAAYSHAQAGTYDGWNWIDDVLNDGPPYTRASQHTWIIARFIEVFGMSEGATRLPGAIAGILLTGLAYPIMLHVTRSRSAALLTSVFVLLTFVGTFRYARMYSLVVPLAFLWTFVHAEALRRLRNTFGSGLVLLGASGAIGFLAYELHINTLSLAAAFALPTALALHAALRSRGWSPRLLWPAWAALAIPTALLALSVAERVRWALSPFARRNYSFVDVLFASPLPAPFSGAVGALLIGVVIGVLLRGRATEKVPHPFLMLSLSSLLFAVPFFVFVADRYVSSSYVAHVRVLTIALMATGAALTIRTITSRAMRAAVLVAVLLVTFGTWSVRTDGLYGDAHGYGVHSEAYRIIAAELDRDTDVVLGQYLRTYYAQDPAYRSTTIIGMGSNRSFTLKDLERSVMLKPRAWVTWEARKSYHLQAEVREVIRDRGRQISGPGVDDTRVFIYLIER